MKLGEVLRKCAGGGSARVAVVGDYILDKYLVGDSERISPESPVPVVLVESETVRLGGAGNVVANLRGLGVDAVPVGTVGEDLPGEVVQDHLRRRGCRTRTLVELPDRPTTEKTRVIARNQQVVRIDRERPATLGEAAYEELERVWRNSVSDVAVCVLSDYGKGVCTPEFCRTVIDLARERGVPVLVDPKGDDFDKYRGAACITPNLDETARVVRLDGADDEAVSEAAVAMSERYGIERVLVTRSSQGMSLRTPSRIHHFRARARDVYDVSGAGDTVVAAMAAGLACGLDYPEAAVLANAAAGLVVGKLGTASVERDELRAEAARTTKAGPPGRIVSLSEYLSGAGVWWDEDTRVAVVDGWVERVDRATVEALERASRTADVLVVFAVSDARPDANAGELERPGSADPVVLAGLAAVDAVVLVEAGSPERLGDVRPDVVVRSDAFGAMPSAWADGVPADAELVNLSGGA